MKLMFDRLSATLEHAMDLRLERGNMISGNIANVDTPGFTPVNIEFDQQLADFLSGVVLDGQEGGAFVVPSLCTKSP